MAVVVARTQCASVVYLLVCGSNVYGSSSVHGSKMDSYLEVTSYYTAILYVVLHHERVYVP
jgi:hypothetical protein